MDATFKLDLAGRDEGYIRDVLDTFFETAASHRRKFIAIERGDVCEIGDF
jgi:hypothetical protein